MTSYIDQQFISLLGDKAKNGTEIQNIETLVAKMPFIAKKLADSFGYRFFGTPEEFSRTFDVILDIDKSLRASFMAEMTLPCIEKDTGRQILAIAGFSSNIIGNFEFDELVIITNEIFEIFRGTDTSALEGIEFGEEKAREYVFSLFDDAISKRASDIHIKPEHGAYTIRFRIDGNAIDQDIRSNDFIERVIRILKKEANVDITNRLPHQGGRIQTISNHRVHNWRFQSAKVDGEMEKVVLRLAHKFKNSDGLDDLGYPDYAIKAIRKISIADSGLAFFCGETGSGKTTSLYALLQEKQRSEKIEIYTIEDPIEVNIDGITQIQIHKAEGELRFLYPEAIRTCLRMDPDWLLVGETRDADTAKATIESALTGHMTWTTMHVQSVHELTGRLLTMGIEPYRYIDFIRGAVAQTLIEKLCSCKIDNEDGTSSANSAAHCPKCGGRGYYGRVPVPQIALMRKGGTSFSEEYFSEFHGYTKALEHHYKNGIIDKATHDRHYHEMLLLDTPGASLKEGLK